MFRQRVTAIVALAMTLAGHASAERADYKPSPPFAETLVKARAGDAVAEGLLGLEYATGGAGVPRDKYKAMEWLEKAGAQGNRDAAQNLKLIQDNLAEYQNMKAAAETGNADSEYAFANFTREDSIGMLDGNGFEPSMAMTWFRRAANQGQPDAEAYMGLYYLRGYAFNTNPKNHNYGAAQAAPDSSNFAQALTWYTRSALQGEPTALYTLPVLYALDTPFHDFSKSEAWLQKAAYAPYVPPPAGAMPSTPAYYAWQQKTSAAEAALYSLWAMYRGLYFSRGVTEYDQFLTVDVPTQRDEKKLFLCILRMQERPMLGKMDEALAEMYQFGRGTPVNETKAAKLYMGVFQNGFRHPDDVQRAEAGLGLMRYSHGDLKKAYFWLSQAYDYGKPEPSDALDYGAPASEHLFPQAKLAMDRITARLTPSERAKQEAAFKAWQAALPPSSWPKPIPEFF